MAVFNSPQKRAMGKQGVQRLGYSGLRKYKEAKGIHFMESTLLINAPKALEERVTDKSQQFSPAALLQLSQDTSPHRTHILLTACP